MYIVNLKHLKLILEEEESNHIAGNKTGNLHSASWDLSWLNGTILTRCLLSQVWAPSQSNLNICLLWLTSDLRFQFKNSPSQYLACPSGLWSQKFVEAYIYCFYPCCFFKKLHLMKWPSTSALLKNQVHHIIALIHN